MIDFALTKSGDINFESAPDQKRLKIRFTADEKYPKMKVWFDVRQENTATPVNKDALKIRFDTNPDREPGIRTETVSELKEICQGVYIRLRTEMGEISGYDSFGSLLVDTKHNDLVNDKTLRAIEDAAVNAVADIFPDAVCNAVVENDPDAGYFYCQHVSLYIKDGGYTYFKFTGDSILGARIEPYGGQSDASVSNDDIIKENLTTAVIVPGDTDQVIYPSDGYKGFSRITVTAIPSNYGKITWNVDSIRVS